MNLTKFPLVLAAIVALLAFEGASVASAAQYKSSSTPVNLSGNQNKTHVFTVMGQNVSCTSATFNKSGQSTPANEIPGIVASYNNCNAFGFAATVNMGTCTYNFDTPNAGLTATVDIACTNNANLNGNATNNGDARINANVIGTICEVHIESQNNKGTLVFENDKPNMGDVLVKSEINLANNGGTNALTAEITQTNGFCPLGKKNGVVVNDATYNGETGVTGNGAINVEVG